MCACTTGKCTRITDRIMGCGASSGQADVPRATNDLSTIIKAVEEDMNNPSNWNDLGVAGGGTVAGEDLDAAKCYNRALELDPGNAVAWNNLLESDPTNANIWYELGHRSGGIINNQTFKKADCYLKVVELDPDPTKARSWHCIGYGGGGCLGGEWLNKRECFDRAVELEPEYALLWFKFNLQL